MDTEPHAALNGYTVDLVNIDQKENLVDTIIRHGLAEISSHWFPCIVTHIYLTTDFYVQKVDDENAKMLCNLQDTIHAKIAANSLKPIEKLVLNKLCIAFFNEDENYYRAKIIGFNNSTKKNIDDIKTDLEIEVFYIDYGNIFYYVKRDIGNKNL